MELTRRSLRDVAAWEAAGVALPKYDIEDMALHTEAEPVWAHFGTGNIFRGFIAGIQNTLLEMGQQQRGITAIAGFDYEVVERMYGPHDNLVLCSTLLPDGGMKNSVIASVAEAFTTRERGMLRQVFESESLQLASFTITEKGYRLRDMDGKYLPSVRADLTAGPDACQGLMAVVCACLHWRFLASEAPIALVSMDNCSSNGQRLREAVLCVAQEWDALSLTAPGFLVYLSDESRVSFPWTMIDKITPRPAESVRAALEALGIRGMDPITTEKNTFVAPFVNAEAPGYLVVEDAFPNGRPPLQLAGVLLTDRQTVNDCERMKVQTCLNPLHTALAVFGCVLGFEGIAQEMRDPILSALVHRLGAEGMRVVVDPKVISPERFLHEALTERLPNPFLPDTPQRIATDTSQKVGIRFGETIKNYLLRPDLCLDSLVALPLGIAGWLRYLLGLDDSGRPFRVSADPMLEQLQAALSGVEWGKPESAVGKLAPILANERLFGLNLCETELGAKIEDLFMQMIAGKGAVRATLGKYLS